MIKFQSYIFYPLGIGRHVDHIIVREAVLANKDLDKKLYFYEESPYMISFDRAGEISEFEIQLKKFQLNAMIRHPQVSE